MFYLVMFGLLIIGLLIIVSVTRFIADLFGKKKVSFGVGYNLVRLGIFTQFIYVYTILVIIAFHIHLWIGLGIAIILGIGLIGKLSELSSDVRRVMDSGVKRTDELSDLNDSKNAE